jgi:hypothetical protein
MRDLERVVHGPVEHSLKGYGQQKYAAMLRESFEPFEQFTATPRSLPDSLDSELAEDLSCSPLFAALRLPRPGE